MAIILTGAVSPSLGTDAYTAGDAIGAKQTVSDVPDRGIIRSILVHDSDDQGINLNVWFFDSEPAGVADDAVFTLADADADKVLGMVLVDTWNDGNGNQVGEEHPNLYYETTGNVLNFQLETLGTPTYTAAGVKIRFLVEGQ